MSLILELKPAAGPALVVGGGVIASRKVESLVEAGFAVVVIAPEVASAIRSLPRVSVHERPIGDDDIDAAAYALVLSCTGDRETNRRVGDLARQRRIPVLVADRQEESTLHMPATLREGDLTVAVSTGGAAPSVARAVRERLRTAIGPGWQREIERAAERRTRRPDAGQRPLLVLAGHGSESDPESSAPLHAAASAIAERGDFEVRCAFWRGSPSLAETRALFPGRRAVVVPFFTAAGHYSDVVVPRELALVGETTHVEGGFVCYTQPVGAVKSFDRAVLSRAAEAGGTANDALVILAHGTPRHAKSGESALASAERIRALRAFAEVEVLFLEQAPNVRDAFEAVSAARVVAVPFFVADGFHVREDLPRLLGVEGGIARRDGRELHYTRAAGSHPEVAGIVLDLALEALAQPRTEAADGTR